MRYLISLFFLLLTFYCQSQNQYSIENIPTELSKDVNAVIRNLSTKIVLKDFDDVIITRKEVTTVYNKRGLSSILAAVGYDKSSSVKSIEAIVYDGNGKEIKKFKKRDFIDVSASGSNLYTDNRKLTLDFTPSYYPFTFEFNVETRSSSTAFLPRWDPSPMYGVSTEYSKYEIINVKQIPLTTRKFNLEDFDVSVVEVPGRFSYTVKNIAAVEREHLSPHYTEFTPVVKIALQKFQLKNKTATIETWKDFGLWQKNSLLKGRDLLPVQTKQKVDQLVENITDPKEKARAIYKFMQDRTRYISVQVGIGGWQPSPAEEVDKLKYGDCKGLTNYTYALLKSQGIESYYTIVDAGPNGRDLDENFVALQGNHVILTIPFEDETIFLECTSQQLPFNYLGTHTDNRKVLMITPEGGVMTKTHVYTPTDNLVKIKASAILTDDLQLSGILEEVSSGIAYDRKYKLENKNKDDISVYYTDLWAHLNSLSVSNIKFINDKKAVIFTEKLNFKTEGYVSKAGNKILINPNVFNRYQYVPHSDHSRSLPLEIRRGYSNIDEIELLLPPTYTIESLFDPIVIETKFGFYKASITKIGESKLLYKREIIIYSGRYPKEEYNNYVSFRKNIVKKDNSKIVLTRS